MALHAAILICALLANARAAEYNGGHGGENMAKKLLASLVTAAAISSVLTDVGSAQALDPTLKQHQQHKMNRAIDDGMIKRAPRIGDEQMARKAPQNIDDGIFKPGSVFKTYKQGSRR
jgi:hypothetical protein